MKKAIILLSGGLDSATSLAIAKQQGFQCHALSFDYGQRHKIELSIANKIAQEMGVTEHKIAKIDLRIFGGSALTADIDVPKNLSESDFSCVDFSQSQHEKAENSVSSGASKASSATEKPTQSLSNRTDSLQSQKKQSAKNPPSQHEKCANPEIPITYVPARNTIFLSYALAYGETIGAFDIFIGANSLDYSGYPDCREEYLRSFETMANLGTAACVNGAHQFKIHAPLLKMTKAQIIQTGLKLGVNYAKTHSCYDPKIAADGEIISCGKCDSCKFRLKGFAEIGVKDEVKYAS